MPTRRSRTEGPAGLQGAYVARPGGRCAPAVVVLSRGAGRLLRPICDDLAAQGFLAIGPRREGAAARDARRAMLTASLLLEHARALPEANGKAGLLGFGRDGLLAFGVAARCPCDASVVYGADPLARLVAEGLCLRGPALLHLPLGPADATSALYNAELAALERNPRIELHLYPGAHAAAEAALARGRSLRFLRQMLGD